MWHPIETAPKDGTVILLFYPNMYFQGKSPFAPAASWGQSCGYWSTDPDHPMTNRWSALDGDSNGEPSRWQPLPAPPQPKEKAA